MIFAYDTEEALISAAALINTGIDGEQLRTPADLDVFVSAQQFSGSRTHDEAELQLVHKMRRKLTKMWTAPETEAVAQVNKLLNQAKALPQLVKHDAYDWHLHATTPETSLGLRLAVEAAMALVDVIRSKELERLRVCAADDCHAVVVDLSKNRSRRFCDTGNCANRTHVAAYRARKASS